MTGITKEYELWATDTANVVGREMSREHFTRNQVMRWAPFLTRLRAIHTDYNPRDVLDTLKPHPMDERLRQVAVASYDMDQANNPHPEIDYAP